MLKGRLVYYIGCLSSRQIYGDITQTASPEELESLLARFSNSVPRVIEHLKKEVHRIGYQKLVQKLFVVDKIYV